ncbi:MAG: hypothetical protein PHY93_15615, partial [Bacteriovorax sp.]|nr:hypothetical protein [Bacteriovorax sp.]
QSNGGIGGNNAGGIVGSETSGSPSNVFIDNVHVSHSSIRGSDNVSGLVGINYGMLAKSSFNGTIKASDSTGTSAGGLVGTNNFGAITNSYSEGLINSSVLNNGGIVAMTTGGTITNVYSTMIMNISYSGISNTGGIIGIATSAPTFSNHLFDGYIKVSSGQSSTHGAYGSGVGPVSSCINGSNFTDNNCTSVSYLQLRGFASTTLSAALAVSNTSLTVTLGSEFPVGPGTIRIGTEEIAYTAVAGNTITISPAINPHSIGEPVTFIPISGTPWINMSGSIPRLAWETSATRLCLLPDNQAAFGSQVNRNGSLATPYAVCNLSQLSALVTASSLTQHYRLLDDLNISPFNTVSPIASFAGDFNGDGFSLYGANITTTTNSGAGLTQGLFQVLTGELRNLNIAGVTINNNANPTDVGTGILVGRNEGVIQNIDIEASTISGESNVGMLVGVNTATISDINIDYGNVAYGNINVGGVVGLASSTSHISKIDSQAKISNYSIAYNALGGIVGQNYGTIDQVKYGGQITMSISSSLATAAGFSPPLPRIGGLVGDNAGAIHNAYTSNYSSMNVKDVNGIGGLVGTNFATGTIDHSFALGKVIYDYSFAPGPAGAVIVSTSFFHSLIGYNEIAPNPTNFYLEKNIGALVDSKSTSGGCTYTNPTQTCSIAGTFSTSFANAFSPTYGGSGMSLSNMISTSTPITTATSAFQVTDPILVTTGLAVSLNFYNLFTITNTTGVHAPADFGAISTFCGTFSADATGDQHCTDGGYDIANSSIGANRINAYYAAFMNGSPTPPNTPIWEIDNEGYPDLVQVGHN